MTEIKSDQYGYLVEEVFDAVEDSGIERGSIRFVYLFGSYLEDPEEANDIDLAVSLDVKNHERAEYKLRGRVPEGLDLSVFECLPLQVKKEVLEGELIYAGDNSVYDIAYQTLKDFSRFEPFYRISIGA